MTLFIHAPNVHQGGGRTLLDALVASAKPGTFALLDERMQPSLVPVGVELVKFKPTLKSRFGAEVLLAKLATNNDTVLCFGNLPPLFHSSAKVTVFLQNRYLFGGHDFSGFGWGTRLRLHLERWWFRRRGRPAYEIIVQSPTMQRELKQCLGFDSIVLPFIAALDKPRGKVESTAQAKVFDFVYVSSAEPHKNHQALIDAWVLLAGQGVRPSLALTVNESLFPQIVQLLEHAKSSHGLKITNCGSLQHGEVQALYTKSRALIFPSRMESFGLPLLEAQQLGMPILAPELDYVRDVVEPAQTFNADSPTSIARAVMRHMNTPVDQALPIDAAVFLSRVLG